MTSPLRSPFAQRWLVPAAAGLAVIGGGVAIGVVTARADSAPAPRSAADLLVDLQTARLDGLSGTVVQRADLGLADPGLLAPLTGETKGVADGTHTIRVWYSGPDRSRVAVVDTLGETDVITNGRDVWVWSSRENSAVHRSVDPRGSGTRAGAAASPFAALLPGAAADSGVTITPDQVARMALAALGPSTTVSTGGPDHVAGREVYELVLEPKDPATLVGAIRLAVDTERHVPLRLRILPRGSTAPAFEAAFTQISFARPDDAEFTFNPPPGGTLTEAPTPTPSATPSTPAHARGGFALVGSGWTSVVVVRLPAAPPADVLARLPAVSGAWGSGRLLTGRLFSVLVTDDGRLLAGAVGPTRLYLAAADPAAALPR